MGYWLALGDRLVLRVDRRRSPNGPYVYAVQLVTLAAR